MFRSLVHYTLVVFVAFIAYNYLDEFFVYIGEPVFVSSVYGKLKGKILQARGGREIYSFTSIPYAKPPLGDLRFEAPVPYGKWEDAILDATRPVKLCLQVDHTWKKILGEEDCLHLHVHTPNLDTSKPLLPVMVWFHGGHFMYGGNNIYGPDYLLQNGDVVLVTVNYRLNSLGFLSTGDDVIPGNMGLKDQTLALKWVQRTIRDFGGNPELVTLFGCSAGGASVNYHMVSPLSKGLFQRGISQSGSSFCPWAFTRDPKNQAMRLAEKLNCSIEASKSSSELVKCLRRKDATEIVAVHKETINIYHDIDTIFGPTIEHTGASTGKEKYIGAFLPESPYKLYKSGKFHYVPWIAGVTSEEGCFRSSLVLPYDDKLSVLNEEWSQVAPKTFLLYNDDVTLSEKVRNYYFGSSSESAKLKPVTTKDSVNEIKENKPQQRQKIGWDDLESLTNAYSDRYFFGCVRDAAVLHAKHAPVHLYYYTYKPDISFGYIQETTPGRIPVQIEVIIGYLKFRLYRDVLKWDINDYGVCHTDELQNLFSLDPLLRIDENSPHYAFSTKLVNMWTSFAKNGKPDDFAGVSWTSVQVDKKTNETVIPIQYLRLGKVPAMIDEPFTKRLKFWEDLNLPKN